jgi:serine/threonine protein kinase
LRFFLQLADFGLAIQVDEDAEGQMLKTECGSQGYMAPEVIARMPYDGAKADSWSASVVSFVILTGNPPFRIARRGDWWFDQLDVRLCVC